MPTPLWYIKQVSWLYQALVALGFGELRMSLYDFLVTLGQVYFTGIVEQGGNVVGTQVIRLALGKEPEQLSSEHLSRAIRYGQ